jgi:hypothetical protein
MILITLHEEDAEKVYSVIAEELSPNVVQLSKGSRGFDGVIQSDVIILAAMVSPIVVKKIADVLINLINSKSHRQVSVNGMTIKGYSAEQVVQLLSRPQARAQQREKKAK